MKLRYLPWKRQKGCRALTTPAPRVQRLPAPPAKASTATSPPAKAASPARRSAASRPSAIGVQHVAAGHVFDDRAGRQAVLGQADPPGPQIGADLLVQLRIEAVGLQDRLQAAVAVGLFAGPREQGPQQHLGGTGQPRMRAACGGKPRDLVADRRAELPRFLPQPLRRADRIVGRRHHRVAAVVQLGHRAAVVDGEVVDHRVHGEGQRVCNCRFVATISCWRKSWASVLRAGSKINPMPPPEMPPSMRKPTTRAIHPPIRKREMIEAPPTSRAGLACVGGSEPDAPHDQLLPLCA